MKFYRKQPLDAEQFDGSDEMVDKYELIRLIKRFWKTYKNIEFSSY